jgi:hypothetical protein
VNNKDICKRLESLTTDRKNIDYTWQLIERFIAPYRGKFFRDQTSEHEIDWRNRQQYDATAIFDNIMLANTIHSWLFPLNMDFFGLNFRDDSLNEDQPLRAWLDEVVDSMHKELHQSNLNTESGETTLDKTSFGIGYLMEEFEGNELTGEDFKIVFSAIPVKEGYFEEDHNGGVHAFYRRIMWTPSQIISKFKDKGYIPPKVQELYDKGTLDRLEVVYCVWRDGPDSDEALHLAPEKRPFQFKFVLKDTSETMSSGGYYEMPVYLSRWSKTSESKYGYSPSMIALSDVLTLNRWEELAMRSGEKQIDPPRKVTERGLLSDLDASPSGLTVVRNMDELDPLESPPTGLLVTESQRAHFKESIHRAFYLDMLQLKDSPQMTAYETAERTRIMQRALGPVISRNKPSLLSPMISRTFKAMLRFNKLPPMPDSLKDEYKDKDIDVVYTGPMAMSNKLDELQVTQQWLGSIAGMAEYDPEVIDNVDSDKIARGLSVEMSVPADYLRDKVVVDEIRDKREKQKDAAIAAQQAQEEGKAMQEQAAGIRGISDA